ncbi:sec-independent protein translocase protein TATA, chloroplastic [Quillaja saponaria]|uniref:Sec-independent protein translocase protein TATA, chloroplastic n=1 Tax=Quillaja saponaria TaxID=32244 RepID=A0AAD7VJE1_QUISA|nr:sec-independent protein translocase protein TATA, chloroplastic [Quillaja saponaria]
MEIASVTLSLSSSIHKLPISSAFSFSSSSSTFFVNNPTTTLLKKTRINFSNPLVMGRTRTKTEPHRRGLTCNALFGLGVPELVVIAGVAALVFGPKKLPEVGKSIGKTVKSFQQAAKEFETELKKEPDSIQESAAEKPTTLSEEKNQDAEVPSSKESV